MISLVPAPLNLPPCHQLACWYERENYSDALFDQYGVAFPERLSGAVDKRKAEFLAGRYCARLALRKLSQCEAADNEHHGNRCATALPDIEITTGEHRAPNWPAGIVGSITHSKGYACAAVARTDKVHALGIDSEALINERTANNVSSHILTAEENFQANRELVETASQYLTLIFSAKESIFKALHPHVQRYFDFRDARVEFDRSAPGTFRFQLLKDLTAEYSAGYSANGQYALCGNFVHTAVVLLP